MAKRINPHRRSPLIPTRRSRLGGCRRHRVARLTVRAPSMRRVPPALNMQRQRPPVQGQLAAGVARANRTEQRQVHRRIPIRIRGLTRLASAPLRSSHQSAGLRAARTDLHGLLTRLRTQHPPDREQLEHECEHHGDLPRHAPSIADRRGDFHQEIPIPRPQPHLRPTKFTKPPGFTLTRARNPRSASPASSSAAVPSRPSTPRGTPCSRGCTPPPAGDSPTVRYPRTAASRSPQPSPY